MPIRNENIDIYNDAFFQFLNENEDKEEKTFEDSLKEFLEKENSKNSWQKKLNVIYLVHQLRNK